MTEKSRRGGHRKDLTKAQLLDAIKSVKSDDRSIKDSLSSVYEFVNRIERIDNANDFKRAEFKNKERVSF